MKKPRWTNAELLTLGDLYRDGLSYNEIACKLNRTKPAIAYALNKYRDVINVEYRANPEQYETKMPDPSPRAEIKKPWWKVW